MSNINSSMMPIRKTRYCLSYLGIYIELDVYPWLSNYAIMEIELDKENDKYSVPGFIEVLEDITDDPSIKNSEIAKSRIVQLYPAMLTILSEMKELKRNNIKPKLKTISYALPSKKVNFSCSEVMNHWNTLCFIHVINSPDPYIIISYYEEDEKIKELEKIKTDYERAIFSSDKMEILYPFMTILLVNAQNIYFNKKHLIICQMK